MQSLKAFPFLKPTLVMFALLMIPLAGFGVYFNTVEWELGYYSPVGTIFLFLGYVAYNEACKL